MRRQKEHCNYYTRQREPCFNLNIGDCIKPINGRFSPHVCLGVCNKYDDSAYKIKQGISGVKRLNKVKGNDNAAD